MQYILWAVSVGFVLTLGLGLAGLITGNQLFFLPILVLGLSLILVAFFLTDKRRPEQKTSNRDILIVIAFTVFGTLMLAGVFTAYTIQRVTSGILGQQVKIAEFHASSDKTLVGLRGIRILNFPGLYPEDILRADLMGMRLSDIRDDAVIVDGIVVKDVRLYRNVSGRDVNFDLLRASLEDNQVTGRCKWRKATFWTLKILEFMTNLIPQEGRSVYIDFSETPIWLPVYRCKDFAVRNIQITDVTLTSLTEGEILDADYDIIRLPDIFLEDIGTTRHPVSAEKLLLRVMEEILDTAEAVLAGEYFEDENQNSGF